MSLPTVLRNLRALATSTTSVNRLCLAEAMHKCLSRARLERLYFIPEKETCLFVTKKRTHKASAISLSSWIPDTSNPLSPGDAIPKTVLNKVAEYLREGYALVGFKNKSKSAVVFKPSELVEGIDYVLPPFKEVK